MTLYFLILFIISIFFFFYRCFCRRVPILMYHRIAAISGDRNALPPEKFKEQLDYLAAHGFTTITSRQLLAHCYADVPLPPKSVLLTFDDGYVDNLLVALPLLQEHRMTAVVFPIAHWVGRENGWENFHKAPTQTMNWEELKCWQRAGLEIGSHTLEHPFLSQCDPARLQKELQESKAVLEEKLQAPVNVLCYPYGDFTSTVSNAAKQAGYSAAFAIFEHVPLWRLDPYALPRIPIPAKQRLWEFKLKVSAFHILFIVLRQWERWCKRMLRRLHN